MSRGSSAVNLRWILAIQTVRDGLEADQTRMKAGMGVIRDLSLSSLVSFQSRVILEIKTN